MGFRRKAFGIALVSFVVLVGFGPAAPACAQMDDAFRMCDAAFDDVVKFVPLPGAGQWVHETYRHELVFIDSSRQVAKIPLPQDAQRKMELAVPLEKLKALVFSTVGGGVYVAGLPHREAGGETLELVAHGQLLQVLPRRPRSRSVVLRVRTADDQILTFRVGRGRDGRLRSFSELSDDGRL